MQQYGGASEETFKLGDIGDLKDLGDWTPASVAILLGLVGQVAAARGFGAGGASTNTFWDSFGLEAAVAKGASIAVLLLATKWAYTSFYTMGASRPWSPLVFVAILLAFQSLHDILFYYGLLRTVPAGKNEMVDSLKRVVVENGAGVMAGHAVAAIVVAVAAMLLKESSSLLVLVLALLALYVFPLLLTTAGPKAAPAVAKVQPAAKTGEGGVQQGGQGHQPPRMTAGGPRSNGAFDTPLWAAAAAGMGGY
jgi:hypothetical protein